MTAYTSELLYNICGDSSNQTMAIMYRFI